MAEIAALVISTGLQWWILTLLVSACLIAQCGALTVRVVTVVTDSVSSVMRW